MGTPGKNPTPSKRGIVKGWTLGAVRRHTRWLYSIDAPALDGEGIAVTLTMRDTPATSGEFFALREAFLQRVRRAGAIRLHWIVEWQRRGTPHLHLAIYFPAGSVAWVEAARLRAAWLEIAERYTVTADAQYWDHITGPLGWLQYLSKHASRGVNHYQRSGHPEGWETTGRLWGKGGSWPSDDPMKFELSGAAGHRYRRLVRSWRVADARESLRSLSVRSADPKLISGARRRLVLARGMLRSNQPRLSAVRGVTDWVPEPTSLAFLELLQIDGALVIQHVD